MKYLLLLLVGCAPPVPIHNCSQEFRDQWWLLDPEDTDSMGAASEVCIHVSSNGQMNIRTSGMEHFGPFEWECQDVDYYRVRTQGFFEATPVDEETWILDINYHGVVNRVAQVTPCWWYSYYY
jgi:hypothetical protein